jgi:hypothetical protein
MVRPSQKKPWRGTWGPLGDRRSKVSKLAQTIEGELREEYDSRRPLAARRIEIAAAFIAAATKELKTVGVDPVATPGRASVLLRRAQRELAMLEKQQVRPSDLRSALAGAGRRA